ncbi:DUF6783 domain-containing protein, partial [Anaerobutyricum hallii]
DAHLAESIFQTRSSMVDNF